MKLYSKKMHVVDFSALLLMMMSVGALIGASISSGEPPTFLFIIYIATAVLKITTSFIFPTKD